VTVETEAMTVRRPARAWLAGAVGAAVGVAGLTSTAQAAGHFHWWAGFIVVPGALIAASGAVLLAQGRSTGKGLFGYVTACAGALVFTVGALLMVGKMGEGWPLMISLPALAVAGTYAWRPEHPLARAFHRMIASLAVAGAALGVTFVLMNTGALDLEGDWWGWFMMLGAVLVALNGLELLRHRIEYRLQAVALAIGPAAFVFLLGLRMARGAWPY
jgi:hypothetical protein